MARLIVIGAGAMGLAAAFHASRLGHEVVVVEAGSEPGGMAGHFDFGGISLERFYHFVCKTDWPTFALLETLGLSDKMHWRPTSMGVFTGGRLHRWGDPVALLKFPHLGPIGKLRYGIFAFVCTRRDSWPALEITPATQWLRRWCGEEVYQRLWKSLLGYKFYELADNVSAAWIWTRIRRVGRSRKSIMQEELGYIEGGSITLVRALTEHIEAAGGTVMLGTPAQQVTTADGKVTGVQTAAGHLAADAVISTVPTPYLASLLPDLPEEWKSKYASIQNIACICITFKLKKSVSPHFWVNISEPDIEIPGIIEFSNLRPFGDDVIVYVPYYMPSTHEKFSWSDEQLVQESFACLQRVNPALSKGDVQMARVARLRHGQPVCEPGFAQKIPPVQTPIAGLQVADTCFYYPEDRGIAESVRLGQQMAEHLGKADKSHA